MLTLERFEHELIKIKNSVGPGHIGPRQQFVCGDRFCIVGQLMVNTSEAKVRTGYIDGEEYNFLGIGDLERHFDPLAIEAVLLMMQMNDAGVPWHKIIDSVLAMTGANAVIKPEESKELLPV